MLKMQWRFIRAGQSMLQVPREFQQQGHAFVDSAWMTFDEANRELGADEASVKVFVGGGLMPLRKNHEAETHYGKYDKTGKAWCFNLGDMPSIPTAEETSHARRYRGIYHRAEFTSDETRVNPALKIFRAQPKLKDWIRAGGEAAATFWKALVIPYCAQRTPEERRRFLEYPPHDSQLYKDSQWLHKRMAGTTKDPSPDVVAGCDITHALGPRATGSRLTQEDCDAIESAVAAMTRPAAEGRDPRCIWSERDLRQCIRGQAVKDLHRSVERSIYFLRISPGKVYAGETSTSARETLVRHSQSTVHTRKL